MNLVADAVISPEPAARPSPVVPSFRASGAAPADPSVLHKLAHELRTPLGAVLGFASLAAIDSDAPLNSTQLRRIRLIEDAGRHMLGIIEELLTKPSGALHAVPAHESPNDLDEVAAAVCHWLEPDARRQSITLRRGTLPPMPVGDALALRQVLINLVSNAIKYGRPGGLVEVGASRSLRPGWIGIEVADSGRGIDASLLDRLFVAYDRLGAEHGDIEGTGIGLSIVKQLVDKLHGRIEVTSEVGVGSVFTVWLPRPQ